MPTPAERKDLRQAWRHLDKAIEEIDTLPEATPGTIGQGARLRAQRQISDARLIIDRVEQGRSG